MARGVYQKQYVSQCVVCHKDFTHYTKVRLCLCSKQCRSKWRTIHRGEPRVEKACLVCGTMFLPKSKKSQKFCSNRCRHKYGARLRTQEGKGFRVHRKILYYKDCAYCGKEFGVIAADRATCCSRECGFKHVAAQQQPSDIEVLRRARASLLRMLRRITSCRVCGAKRLDTGTCSRACKLEDGRRRYYEERNKRWAQKQCKDCGQIYQEYKKGSQFCAACNDTRKTLQRICRDGRFKQKEYRGYPVIIEAFKRKEIFERDKYICKLCGKKTKPKAHYNDDFYPTLDHIIPKSERIIHTRANVQTAHRICNMKKRTRAMGEQLFLIG